MEFFYSLIDVFSSIGYTLIDASFYLLIGFLCAGILKAFVHTDTVVKYIGQPTMSSVLKASFIGVPMPLCSCSVIPMAVSLNKSGASKGATVSFLVSAPETGVDSIAISYAMLDPLMTVFRPLAAFCTAFFSGILENTISRRKTDVPVLESAQQSTLNEDCNTENCQCHGEETKNRTDIGVMYKLKNGIKYAFGDLLGDIAYYLLIGLVISGIISSVLPEDFFSTYLQNEFLTMLVMLMVGIPMYVCASASTPIAAALILKGISPGAALVFLLAGPATNLSTMAVVKNMLGRKSFVSYILSISGAAMLFGFLLNAVYLYFDIPIIVNLGSASETVPDWVKFCSAVLLLPLLFRGLYKEVKHRFSKK